MRGWPVMLMLTLCAAWSRAGAEQPSEARVDRRDTADLDRRYQALLDHLEPYGEGGREVLNVAYRVLREGQTESHWELVGLEDLWAQAIKEGAVLFNQPARRWGLTRAGGGEENFAQSTVGPWQITINNIRAIYGPSYGVEEDWTLWHTYEYCRDHPEVQAAMAADYIQESYAKFGVRGPYAIQRYYSLNNYLRGVIGQGAWDRSVTAVPPGGDPALVSPEAKANTGFYAKQVLLGTRANPRGLLYWLWATGDTEAIRAALRTWRDQPRMSWDFAGNKPVLTEAPGKFGIQSEDLKYLQISPRCYVEVSALVDEVSRESRTEALSASSEP